MEDLFTFAKNRQSTNVSSNEALQVIDKRQCQFVSQRMEAEAFEKVMTHLHKSMVHVQEVVTDAHPSISGIMRK